MTDAMPQNGWDADCIIAEIDAIRRTPTRRDDLVPLLDERSAIYLGRGNSEVDRLRGYLLASFAMTGLPAAGLPYVIEELETGRNPYAVAAAARALRGSSAVSEEIVNLLLAAVERIRSNDQMVSFDACFPQPVTADSPTALGELIRTVAWLGPAAQSARGALRAWLRQPQGAFSTAVRQEMQTALEAIAKPSSGGNGTCCGQTERTENVVRSPAEQSFDDRFWQTPMQDQDGTCLTLQDALLGRPTALAFFYTRCMNPEKCSLTITKLARLQRRLFDRGLNGKFNVAGITYDPRFDVPARLKVYGADRGMIFDPYTRLLRTTVSFEHLSKWVDLGVGYGPVTVNRHRLDFMALDKVGRVTFSHRRRLWLEDDVLDALLKIDGSERHSRLTM